MDKQSSNVMTLAKYLRLVNGLSQAQLAEKCGVTANDVSRFERGNMGVRISTVEKMAKYLGVSIDDLARNNYVHALLNLKRNEPCNISEAKVDTTF